MASKPSDKNTKAQILEAYDQLAQEQKALETQLKQLQKEAKDKPPVASTQKNQQPVSAINQQQVASDKMVLTIDSIIKLQSGFGSTVSELSEKLTTEAAKLAELQNSVAEEIQQLEELHDLEEIKEDTLDVLSKLMKIAQKLFRKNLVKGEKP